MVYRSLADLVVVVHAAFILFVAAGGLLAWRWPSVVVSHVPCLAWAAASITVGLPCPLTALEKSFRRLGGGQAYEGGFVDRYIEGVVYPGSLTSALRAVAALAVVLGYAGVLRRRAGLDRAAARRLLP